jgi:D-sedoheptulose 7-phosphate isomerase
MIVFTNGCFDIIHPGHVDLLTRARALGSRLIVGINSDESVKRIKGPDRPLQDQNARRDVLLGLKAVDEVHIFDELTPQNLIEKITPDVLVKGGDWNENEIVGAEFVRGRGGSVHSLPLLEGFSSTAVINRLNRIQPEAEQAAADRSSASLKEHSGVMQRVFDELRPEMGRCSEILLETVRSGKKVLVCGNGGSAADAQHIAAEFVGRYETERRALPAIALTTDTSALTALANDYSFERVFSRQVEALAVEGDCLIAISTSGNSPNVIAAVMAARSRGCRVIGMTGEAGKKLASLSDACVMVPASRTARIQEAHITIAHIWCELVDEELASENQ